MQNYNSKFKTDLKQRCYRFALELLKLIDRLPVSTGSRVIADQLLRSGTSIGANLVEASASSSRLEFKKFNEISLKSANESKFWLELLRDSGKGPRPEIDQLLYELDQLCRMIAAGILKLKGKSFKF